MLFKALHMNTLLCYLHSVRMYNLITYFVVYLFSII